jgi:hypothetical protein
MVVRGGAKVAGLEEEMAAAPCVLTDGPVRFTEMLAHSNEGTATRPPILDVAHQFEPIHED